MTKKVLTPEQVERLQPVARHLERAVKGSEIIGITATEVRNVIFPTYKEVYGDNPGNAYCNHCIMRACQRLGVLYLEATAKKAAETPAAPEVEEHTAEEEKTPQKVKKSKKTTKK
jgi:hypothetical protein